MAASYGLILTGLAAIASGVALLRVSWRQQRYHSMLVFGGWGLLIASLVPFTYAAGEMGPAYAVAAYCIVGITAVLTNIQFRAARAKSTTPEAIDPAAHDSRFWLLALHFTAACILSGISAFAGGVAVAACTFGPSPNLVVFTGSAMLVLWAVLAIWAATDARVVRSFGALILIALGATALVRLGLCA